MRNIIGFLKDDRGLTTIEWVSLCAVVLLAAMGISAFVLQGADRLGGSVAHGMIQAADDVDPD
jgi:hypothetical protein